MTNPCDVSLYVVSDRTMMRGRSYAQLIPELIRGGMTVFQLREKDVDSRVFYEVAQEIKTLLKGTSIPLIINDRVDIALAVGADGIHLGQSDLPCSVVRTFVPKEWIVGISAATEADVRRAEDEGADYIGVGTVYATSTKTDAGAPVGCDRIASLRAVTSLPIVGIGGITLANAGAVIQSGADGVAVISALLSADNLVETAAQFTQCITAQRAIKKDIDDNKGTAMENNEDVDVEDFENYDFMDLDEMFVELGFTREDLQTAPIYASYAEHRIFEIGLGNMLIARKLPNGLIVFSMFLVDCFCNGVKDILFSIEEPEDFKETLDYIMINNDLVSVAPAYVRKLVEQSVAYAKNLGFEPPEEYADSALIFGNIDVAKCEDTFSFGRDGRPMYIPGMTDTDDEMDRVLAQLEERCGSDGFDFMEPSDE
ncbi:MAG: thiamine phosphate synthase [Spartobacteria bacterium]|nr:thiamine phosphate synthase [Spartobacteria bacterium]